MWSDALLRQYYQWHWTLLTGEEQKSARKKGEKATCGKLNCNQNYNEEWQIITTVFFLMRWEVSWKIRKLKEKWTPLIIEVCRKDIVEREARLEKYVKNDEHNIKKNTTF